MGRLIVMPGKVDGTTKRVLRTMVAMMIGAIKDGRADTAAHFAVLAGRAAAALNPAAA